MPAATKVEREKLCSRFALDMTFRCTAERSQATNHYKGDFLKIKSGISYTVDAIAHCYMGDHNLCKKYSLVCDGEITTGLPEVHSFHGTLQLRYKIQIQMIQRINYVNVSTCASDRPFWIKPNWTLTPRKVSRQIKFWEGPYQGILTLRPISPEDVTLVFTLAIMVLQSRLSSCVMALAALSLLVLL